MNQIYNNLCRKAEGKKIIGSSYFIVTDFAPVTKLTPKNSIDNNVEIILVIFEL